MRILHEYEDGHIQAFTAFTIIFVFIVDSVTFSFSLLNIIVLFKLRSETYYQWLNKVLRIALYICTCDGRQRFYTPYYEPFQQTDNEHTGNDSDHEEVDNDSEQTDNAESVVERKAKLQKDLKEEKVNELLRKESWFLQKRQEKRQLEPVKCWLKKLKNDLDQQSDELEKRECHYNLLKYQLPEENYSADVLKSMVKDWRDRLDKWFSELTSPIPIPGSGTSRSQSASNSEIPASELSIAAPEVKITKDMLEEQYKKQDKKQSDLDEWEYQLQKKLLSVIPDSEHKKEDPEHRAKLKKRIFSENKSWLLLLSFIAPIACIGTHGGFVIMAWASDPGEAGSIAVVFALSFFYYFIGFRHLYIRISSLQWFKNKENKFKDAYDVTIDLEKHYNNLHEINIPVLCCELFFIPIFMGIQALIVFSYYYLPGPISSVPLNVMNLLQLVLFFGTGLITYKLFTFGAPVEEIILDGFMKAYRSQGGSSGNTAGGVGEALASALTTFTDSRGRSNAPDNNLIELESLDANT